MISCKEDSPKFSVSRDKSLIDTGIYDSDSVNNTTEEEFKSDIDNAALPQVGTMSPLIRDELILEYISCTDVKVSSSCWDGVTLLNIVKDKMFTRYEMVGQVLMLLTPCLYLMACADVWRYIYRYS